MLTQQQLLDAGATAAGGSDYKLAQALGVHRQHVSMWRTGKKRIGERYALEIAELSGTDPGYAVACLRAERAESATVKRMWVRVAKVVKAGQSASLLALAGAPALLSAMDGGGYILCKKAGHRRVRQIVTPRIPRRATGINDAPARHRVMLPSCRQLPTDAAARGTA